MFGNRIARLATAAQAAMEAPLRQKYKILDTADKIMESCRTKNLDDILVLFENAEFTSEEANTIRGEIKLKPGGEILLNLLRCLRNLRNSFNKNSIFVVSQLNNLHENFLQLKNDLEYIQQNYTRDSCLNTLHIVYDAAIVDYYNDLINKLSNKLENNPDVGIIDIQKPLSSEPILLPKRVESSIPMVPIYDNLGGKRARRRRTRRRTTRRRHRSRRH
jgi:hypothetical protein